MSIYDKSSLVLIPSGTKTGKVYSQKPVSGDGDFTFTRSSAATRVNADGNIEKETQNLLTYSNTFSNAAWNKLGAGSGTAASVTSGFSDPDGGSNAWRLQCDLNGGSLTTDQSLIYQSGSLTGVFAFSYYVKSNTGSSQDFVFGNSLNGYKLATATTSWQRFTTFHNCTSNNNSFIGARGGLNTDDTLDILIYASQVEYGLVARDYIETTTAAVEGGITDNVPRLDYTDSSCPALLLEPQRTNVIESSEYFDGSLWSATNITITNNDIESPEGINNASKIVLDSGSSSSCELRAQNNKSVTLGNDYTFSVFAKSDEFDKIELDFSNSRMDEAFVVADLTNGTIISRGADNTSDSIEDYGNGWYRITLTGTAIATGTTALIFRLGANPTGDGTSGFHIYGAQFEAGSYATSYIPTYGSSVTRTADDCYKTGVANLIGQTEGTLFFDIKDTTNLSAYVGIDNSSSGTRIIMYSLSDGKIYTQVRNGGTIIFSVASSVLNGRAKAAVSFNGSESVFYVNGTQIGSGSGTTYTNLSKVTFNHSSQVGVEINQNLLFKTRLTNAELADLTTL